MKQYATRQHVSLRPYVDSDYPLLAALYGETSQSMLSERALGNRTPSTALPGLLHGVPGLCIILSAEAVPVGLLSAQQRATPDGPVLWIRLLLIAQAQRRRGYGEAAIHQLLGMKWTGGAFQRVLLAVDEQNGIALAFWQAFGFHELRRLNPEKKAASSILILAWEHPNP